ncbi:hypothetical protein [Adhaeribacter radiodurans]|uniref:Uncharacterized protein n=1 Tax=Adhaeribacter radiodurans TaxID=2745197 RepID=A0A7L7LD64_9BACT|nr:hypothetical protein [Adhaeribacter radiodurans]QMU30760.1 hypothetical protein HUW48_23230 [Adhaeribacter radiodurans]
MKLKSYFLLVVLVCIFFVTKGQNIKSLEAVSKQDANPENQAIIYGSFVQRLGFSSGGFAQDIRIMNVETKEIFSFRVKPIFKSAKENAFCFYIKPGSYKILNYWWTESKWYGGKMFTEYIFKGIESSKVADKLKKGEIQVNNLEQYSFRVTDSSVHYLGTWHFDKELVSFSNNKEQLDITIQTEYQKINWVQAKPEIPE